MRLVSPSKDRDSANTAREVLREALEVSSLEDLEKLRHEVMKLASKESMEVFGETSSDDDIGRSDSRADTERGERIVNTAGAARNPRPPGPGPDFAEQVWKSPGSLDLQVMEMMESDQVCPGVSR